MTSYTGDGRPCIIREEARAIDCPHCGGRVPLTYGPDAVTTIRAPRDVANLLAPTMAGLEREELRVLLLNAKNVVRRVVTVYQGNVSAALVRVGELFTEALRDSAAGIILVHNHPSGDPTPSPDDLHLTGEAVAAGRLLDLPVLDHVIIGRDSYVSLSDRGVSFGKRP